MTRRERAEQYAAVFTRAGDRWRECVPVGSGAHRFRDEARIDDVLIARPDGESRWALVDPEEATDA